MCLEKLNRLERENEMRLIHFYGENWRMRHRIKSAAYGEYRCDLCWGKRMLDLGRVIQHIGSKKHKNKVFSDERRANPLAEVPEQ